MARKPRVEYAGAVYHVMNRGDRGGKVFLDKLDYELFLAKLTEACGRTGWNVHAYVLMPNHFHWLLETPEPNLVVGMKWFQEKILDMVGVRLAEKERDSYSGEAMRRHDEREAEALLRKGLKALGMDEDAVMAGKKGALPKSALAWHVHRHALAGHKLDQCTTPNGMSFKPDRSHQPDQARFRG